MLMQSSKLKVADVVGQSRHGRHTHGMHGLQLAGVGFCQHSESVIAAATSAFAPWFWFIQDSFHPEPSWQQLQYLTSVSICFIFTATLCRAGRHRGWPPRRCDRLGRGRRASTVVHADRGSSIKVSRCTAVAGSGATAAAAGSRSRSRHRAAAAPQPGACGRAQQQ